MESLKTVTISKRAELAARGGHPWIYGTEIKSADEGIEAGDIVRVLSSKGKFIGSGFYNPHSKIRVRIFSTNANDVLIRPSGSGGLPMPWITGSRSCGRRIITAAVWYLVRQTSFRE